MPSTNYQILRVVCQVPSTKYQVPSTKCQVPSAKYQVPSTKCQMQSAMYQVPGVMGRIQGELTCLAVVCVVGKHGSRCFNKLSWFSQNTWNSLHHGASDFAMATGTHLGAGSECSKVNNTSPPFAKLFLLRDQHVIDLFRGACAESCC